MLVTETIDEVREARRSAPTERWGLVPTMGYLHEGHLSLVRRARAECDRLAVSIYVNPTQFAPDEDLDTYPRDLSRDLALLREESADLVFTPTDAIMYPEGFQTTVHVEEITQRLEGASRPTHFRGVTTIVTKLFNVIQPHRAYFGQKDAQQAAVIQRMVADLNFNVKIVICPIVREPDGLAMSSRNRRLSPEQRAAAPVLFRALTEAKDALHKGVRDGDSLREIMSAIVHDEPLARLDYVSVADPVTLEELDEVGEHALFSMAVFFGDVRLIDNIPVNTPP